MENNTPSPSRRPRSNCGARTHTRRRHPGARGDAAGGGTARCQLWSPRQRLCQIRHNRSNYVRLNQLIKVASQIYNEGFSFI